MYSFLSVLLAGFTILSSLLIGPSLGGNGAGGESGGAVGDGSAIEAVLPTEQSTDGIVFLEGANGTYTVRGYEGEASEVVIPEYYNGKQVTRIKSGAFKGNKSITSVTLPDSITEISSSAFNGCINLKSIKLGSHVTKIGAAAFLNCLSLESIDLPASVAKIGVSAFMANISLENINIPAGVDFVGANAFTSCPELTIWCEAESAGKVWSPYWNSDPRPVSWAGAEPELPEIDEPGIDTPPEDFPTLNPEFIGAFEPEAIGPAMYPTIKCARDAVLFVAYTAPVSNNALYVQGVNNIKFLGEEYFGEFYIYVYEIDTTNLPTGIPIMATAQHTDENFETVNNYFGLTVVESSDYPGGDYPGGEGGEEKPDEPYMDPYFVGLYDADNGSLIADWIFTYPGKSMKIYMLFANAYPEYAYLDYNGMPTSYEVVEGYADGEVYVDGERYYAMAFDVEPIYEEGEYAPIFGFINGDNEEYQSYRFTVDDGMDAPGGEMPEFIGAFEPEAIGPMWDATIKYAYDARLFVAFTSPVSNLTLSSWEGGYWTPIEDYSTGEFHIYVFELNTTLMPTDTPIDIMVQHGTSGFDIMTHSFTLTVVSGGDYPGGDYPGGEGGEEEGIRWPNVLGTSVLGQMEWGDIAHIPAGEGAVVDIYFGFEFDVLRVIGQGDFYGTDLNFSVRNEKEYFIVSVDCFACEYAYKIGVEYALANGEMGYAYIGVEPSVDFEGGEGGENYPDVPEISEMPEFLGAYTDLDSSNVYDRIELDFGTSAATVYFKFSKEVVPGYVSAPMLNAAVMFADYDAEGNFVVAISVNPHMPCEDFLYFEYTFSEYMIQGSQGINVFVKAPELPKFLGITYDGSYGYTDTISVVQGEIPRVTFVFDGEVYAYDLVEEIGVTVAYSPECYYDGVYYYVTFMIDTGTANRFSEGTNTLTLRYSSMYGDESGEAVMTLNLTVARLIKVLNRDTGEDVTYENSNGYHAYAKGGKLNLIFVYNVLPSEVRFYNSMGINPDEYVCGAVYEYDESLGGYPVYFELSGLRSDKCSVTMRDTYENTFPGEDDCHNAFIIEADMTDGKEPNLLGVSYDGYTISGYELVLERFFYGDVYIIMEGLGDRSYIDVDLYADGKYEVSWGGSVSYNSELGAYVVTSAAFAEYPMNSSGYGPYTYEARVYINAVDYFSFSVTVL